MSKSPKISDKEMQRLFEEEARRIGEFRDLDGFPVEDEETHADGDYETIARAKNFNPNGAMGG